MLAARSRPDLWDSLPAQDIADQQQTQQDTLACNNEMLLWPMLVANARASCLLHGQESMDRQQCTGKSECAGVLLLRLPAACCSSLWWPACPKESSAGP